MMPFDLKLTKPGLFVTGTDTGVGKTVITSGIAASLRQRRDFRVGVSKPFSSGCRMDREGLVNEDVEALAHFSECPQPLEVINPIRYRQPLAPGVAAELQGEHSLDGDLIQRSLTRIEQTSDGILMEGVGGLLVPLGIEPRLWTVLDLIVAVGYPVVVVARANLGTLNHTAMTTALLRQAGCKVVGIVINGYDADVAKQADPSVTTNRSWIEKMTKLPVLAVVPRGDDAKVKPHEGKLAVEIQESLGRVDWLGLLG